MFEEKSLLVEEVRTAYELQRVLHLEEQLIALLVLVRLANDLVRVCQQFRIASPVAIANVGINEFPVAPIVRGIISFHMAVFAEVSTILSTGPYKVVGLHWMEMKHVETQRVRCCWTLELVPCFAGIGRIEESFRVGDKICAIIAVGVHVK